jgi:hypothetical protein
MIEIFRSALKGATANKATAGTSKNNRRSFAALRITVLVSLLGITVIAPL